MPQHVRSWVLCQVFNRYVRECTLSADPRRIRTNVPLSRVCPESVRNARVCPNCPEPARLMINSQDRLHCQDQRYTMGRSTTSPERPQSRHARKRTYRPRHFVLYWSKSDTLSDKSDILGHNTLTYHILSYPIISHHILSYPIIL